MVDDSTSPKLEFYLGYRHLETFDGIEILLTPLPMNYFPNASMGFSVYTVFNLPFTVLYCDHSPWPAGERHGH